jgi:O-succinylbenzoic acid--CoA ligase
MSPLEPFVSSVRRTATDRGDALALVDGTIRWTWGELDRRADAVATGLRRAGIGPSDRVALLAAPSADAIAALHGIARIRAVAVPLGTGLAKVELATAAEVLDARLVVHGPGQEAGAAALGGPLLALSELTALTSGADSEPVDAAVPDGGAPAVVVLTSGTTGRPKAAVLSSAALDASAEAWLAVLPAATGWLLTLGLGHVGGLGVVWRAAMSGVPLVVLPRPDTTAILDALGRDPGPSHVSVVPTMLARMLDAVDGRPRSTLRAVLLGGGPISPDLVRRAIDAGWPIVPTYGLSEAGSGVTALATAEATEHPDSAGRPLPGVRIRIGEPDATGVGEILVDSPARFTGYLGDPAGTSAVLTADGWLRTSDLGRLDLDGRLTVFDRRTDRIVRGGENISPAEVEAVLLEHPAIAEAAVVARRDPTWGHVPVAAIVLRPGIGDPGDDDLALHCRGRLATFKVPVAFVRLEALPRTAGGKVRRVELRASLDQPADASFRHRHVDRPGGLRLAYRSLGDGSVHLLLLHGTLSTAGQLGGLARALAGSGAFTVHAVDRRGSGGSRSAHPVPLDIEVHLGDLAAVLDAERCRAVALFGVSFGGVVALEFAARMPERTLAVVAYEPPYGPVADADTQATFAAVAMATERAHRSGGAPSAAEAFMRGVTGDGTWDRLSDRSRAFLSSEGDGAYVDSGLRGLDPPGLGRIGVPVTVLTGNASDAFYQPIAEVLVDRIPGARLVPLPGLTHASPITDPDPVAGAAIAAFATAGIIQPGSSDPAAKESLA